MSDCPICKDPVKAWEKPKTAHLMITKASDDSVHIHGDLDKRIEVESLLQHAQGELGIVSSKSSKEPPKEVVFRNRQRLGDALMFTCGVRDFKKAYPKTRVGVESIAMHVWDHNPHLDRTLEGSPANRVNIGPGLLTNASNRLDWHFANAYRVSMENALGIQIPQGLSRPDVWFSEEEYNAPRVTKDPYWIIVVTGEKGWGCKMYPFERWQEVVNQNKDITFYQLGAAGDNPPRLVGSNVVDYVGKTEDRDTGIRDLFKLFLNAEGSIGLVSFHMHLSGALYKPSVVIAGGREPASFTKYEGHQYLENGGTMPCSVRACWHCDINACTNLVQTKEQKIPKCVDIISPDEVTAAIRRYYVGGRLKIGVPSEKPSRKFINVNKTPIIHKPAPKPEIAEEKFGLPWGGGSVTDRDWDFLREKIKSEGIKTILEFGAGLSTLLFNELLGCGSVVTYETNQGWIDKLKEIMPGCDIRLWDGKSEVQTSPQFDLSFVDGPAGGQNREQATKLGVAGARKVVVIHDANREFEKLWQEKYVAPSFFGPLKGGHRCHWWVKESQEAVNGSQGVRGAPALTGKGLVKIVSTARGWGGCARSVTTIMKLLLKAGHPVEFIPFRNAVTSREFQQALVTDLRQVKVSNSYEAISESCSTLLVYADDFVWEFGKADIAEAFSGVKAEKKVMMLNYRRGDVGKLEWTKGWDLYAFLNSTQEKELKKFIPDAKTKVLPPCTDLAPFLAVKPDYYHGLRLVRHNSQGDVKFISGNAGSPEREKSIEGVRKEFDLILNSRHDTNISMMPGPSFIPENPRFKKVSKTADPNEIAAFLSKGNCFWYSLPEGYMDMGPRVVLEAMAVGLPIIADNWGGVLDRVKQVDNGWLCGDKYVYHQILRTVSAHELQEKGEAAKQRAAEEFIPEKWLELLV